jgi:hypothetical protein
MAALSSYAVNDDSVIVAFLPCKRAERFRR